MEIWLDTTNATLIQHAKDRGLLFGVTTNPSILAGTKQSPLDVIQELLKIQEGPITVQVTAATAMEMAEQGKRLHELSPRIIVKVPTTSQGLRAIRALSLAKVTTMATVIYEPLQALAAFHAGAIYAAAYVGRMEDAGLKPFETLRAIQEAIDRYYPSRKLMAASLRTKKHLLSCFDVGVAAVTLKEQPYALFVEEHPLTCKNSEEFSSALPAIWLY